MRRILLGFTITGALGACAKPTTEQPWYTDAELREQLIAEAIFHGATLAAAERYYTVQK